VLEEHCAESLPGGTGFANLRTNCLDIVVVLGKKAPKVLEDVDPLKHLVMNVELLTKF
jgi:hypothetical protein